MGGKKGEGESKQKTKTSKTLGFGVFQGFRGKFWCEFTPQNCGAKSLAAKKHGRNPVGRVKHQIQQKKLIQKQVHPGKFMAGFLKNGGLEGDFFLSNWVMAVQPSTWKDWWS